MSLVQISKDAVVRASVDWYMAKLSNNNTYSNKEEFESASEKLSASVKVLLDNMLINFEVPDSKVEGE